MQLKIRERIAQATASFLSKRVNVLPQRVSSFKINKIRGLSLIRFEECK